MPQQFNHEKLTVYQKAIAFVGWSYRITPDIPNSDPVRNQLDRSSVSIPLNIAEGNGKYTESDRCRFFDIARGSALESAAALDVAVVRKHVSSEQVEEGKTVLREIVAMPVGLIRSNSSSRVFEDSVGYSDESR